MRRFFVAALLSLSLLEALPRVPTYQVVRTNNGFGLAYYSTLAKMKERDNFVFSPYGFSASMAMAYLASEGETKTAIADTFYFPLSPNYLGEAFKGFNADLETDTGLGNTTSLWVQKGLSITDAFKERVEQYYQGRFFEADFAVQIDTSRFEINNWVAKQTRKTLPFFMNVSDLPRGTEMLLLATLTLNASWDTPFSPRSTKTENFFSERIRERKVPMMAAEGEFAYLETDRLKVLEIPYAQLEGQLTRPGLWIVLPKEVDGLKSLNQSLSISGFEEWRRQAVKKWVKVKIPRFRVIEVMRGETVLQEMGLKAPFSKEADFSVMSDKKPFISRIFQKTFFSIDERGTRATKFVPLKPQGKPPEGDDEIKEFFANHPFMFFVLDNTSGQLLFLGQVVQP